MVSCRNKRDSTSPSISVQFAMDTWKMKSYSDFSQLMLNNFIDESPEIVTMHCDQHND